MTHYFNTISPNSFNTIERTSHAYINFIGSISQKKKKKKKDELKFLLSTQFKRKMLYFF